MTVVEYDLGYFEGVRNAYAFMVLIHQGHELEEVFKMVVDEMKNAQAIYERTKAEYE
jgi:hypothetical protein